MGGHSTIVLIALETSDLCRPMDCLPGQNCGLSVFPIDFFHDRVAKGRRGRHLREPGKNPDGGCQSVDEGAARTAVAQVGLNRRLFGLGEILIQIVRRKLPDFIAVDIAPVK